MACTYDLIFSRSTLHLTLCGPRLLRTLKVPMGGLNYPPVISQFLHKIETKFQPLTPIFGVYQFIETHRSTVTCNRKLQLQDGGRQTGSIYISASTLDVYVFEVDHVKNYYSGIRQHRPTPETRGSRKPKADESNGRTYSRTYYLALESTLGVATWV
jgi:hypothetical protein